MEQGMQDYLKMIAVQTKIENYRDFDKTKEETEGALMKFFEFTLEEAREMIERFWEGGIQKGTSEEDDDYYVRKKESLLREKEKKMQEYDFAINIIEEAINGFSQEAIARKNGISVEKVQEILNA